MNKSSEIVSKLMLLMGFWSASLAGSSAFGEEIIIVGNSQKPPKVYLEDGEPKGILIDILKHVEERSHYTFEIELYPWKRAYRIAEAGNAGIIGLSMTEQRLEIFDYSEPIFYDEMLLVTLKGKEFSYQRVEDLQGKRIGVRRGSSYGDEFERGKNNKIFIVDEDTTAEQRLKKLLHDRIDAALLGPGVSGFEHALRESNYLAESRDKFVIIEEPFARDPNYLGFAKSSGRRQVLDNFNEILEQAKESGAIARIIARHSYIKSDDEEGKE